MADDERRAEIEAAKQALMVRWIVQANAERYVGGPHTSPMVEPEEYDLDDPPDGMEEQAWLDAECVLAALDRLRDARGDRCGCVCHHGVDGEWTAHTCDCPGCPSDRVRDARGDDEPATFHVDMCPDCGAVPFQHPMDPPWFCDHPRDRYVMVEVAPVRDARGDDGAMEDATAAFADASGWHLYQHIRRGLAAALPYLSSARSPQGEDHERKVHRMDCEWVTSHGACTCGIGIGPLSRPQGEDHEAGIEDDARAYHRICGALWPWWSQQESMTAEEAVRRLVGRVSPSRDGSVAVDREDGGGTMSKQQTGMTPAELIEMLSRWRSGEPFEVLVQNNPWGGSEPIVVLAQGTNTINLTAGPDGRRAARPSRDGSVAVEDVEGLVEALRFYANPASYRQSPPTTGPFSVGALLPIHKDLGCYARAVLTEFSPASTGDQAPKEDQ